MMSYLMRVYSDDIDPTTLTWGWVGAPFSLLIISNRFTDTSLGFLVCVIIILLRSSVLTPYFRAHPFKDSRSHSTQGASLSLPSGSPFSIFPMYSILRPRKFSLVTPPKFSVLAFTELLRARSPCSDLLGGSYHRHAAEDVGARPSRTPSPR